MLSLEEKIKLLSRRSPSPVKEREGVVYHYYIAHGNGESQHDMMFSKKEDLPRLESHILDTFIRDWGYPRDSRVIDRGKTRRGTDFLVIAYGDTRQYVYYWKEGE